ncbi:hypothetical protein HBI56_053740 [Parastagonospora nodorum]|uniref:Uncharacterized protein n=1 Tax=Phaeosphaeria nodorum (strain SN15 / ATCC MYA-4574 / FGSC 10173) TaxID=321614 RepID=A0A7U2ICR4_PHANO|nr:hypothetical protein HBH56_098340 [Parastagonospora nodorum]QRD07368.1 hypothetical protein JI435_424280 [Parastagonospora nodorum SN15]KAH3930413.1 hypothetical protein HBH54_112660 [Parastagonospora nodorum]KAH3938979.1 hypothetical protein HBH53_242010 [Parastagonospora nodorum]KAH3964499.1 hypothetical protein HBH51_159360 [Parastagonospora nodorum]
MSNWRLENIEQHSAQCSDIPQLQIWCPHSPFRARRCSARSHLPIGMGHKGKRKLACRQGSSFRMMCCQLHRSQALLHAQVVD